MRIFPSKPSLSIEAPFFLGEKGMGFVPVTLCTHCTKFWKAKHKWLAILRDESCMQLSGLLYGKKMADDPCPANFIDGNSPETMMKLIINSNQVTPHLAMGGLFWFSSSHCKVFASQTQCASLAPWMFEENFFKGDISLYWVDIPHGLMIQILTCCDGIGPKTRFSAHIYSYHQTFILYLKTSRYAINKSLEFLRYPL